MFYSLKYTAHKKKLSIKDFFSKCDLNPQFPADLVTFTGEILTFCASECVFACVCACWERGYHGFVESKTSLSPEGQYFLGDGLLVRDGKSRKGHLLIYSHLQQLRQFQYL